MGGEGLSHRRSVACCQECAIGGVGMDEDGVVRIHRRQALPTQGHFPRIVPFREDGVGERERLPKAGRRFQRGEGVARRLTSLDSQGVQPGRVARGLSREGDGEPRLRLAIVKGEVKLPCLRGKVACGQR